jgi:hypothetical protein
MAFLFSLSNALSSFSLAIMSPDSAGFLQQINLSNISQQTAIVPVIIMQNTMTWQVISWILVVLCFVNIINCILVLLDYSRITNGGKKGAL